MNLLPVFFCLLSGVICRFASCAVAGLVFQVLVVLWLSGYMTHVMIQCACIIVGPFKALIRSWMVQLALPQQAMLCVARALSVFPW
jgi:hypothetical protein